MYTNSKTGQVSDYCGLSCLNADDPVLGESIDQRRSAAKVEPTEGRRIQILVINECGNILTYTCCTSAPARPDSDNITS